MNLTTGAILIVIAVAMVVVARPKDGVSARFLKEPWVVGQLYLMTAMVFGVVGTAFVIVNWP